MKRCSFIICFALIFMLAMPMKVDAAPVAYSYILAMTNGDRYMSYEEYNNGRQVRVGASPIYFVILDDGFYMCYQNSNYEVAARGFCSYPSDGNRMPINTYTSGEMNTELIGRTWSCVLYVAWGEKFGSDVEGTGMYAQPGNGTYIVNSESELLALFDQDASVGSFYKLYDTETSYTEAIDFFQKPPVAGVLEKNLKTVLQKMEVTPLTEVVKILPIGLACLVGWIGLRKGLSLLRQVLFPA